MAEHVTLRLPRKVAGQLLKCLEATVEDWSRTRTSVEHGVIDPEEPYVRDCSSVSEAEENETFFRQIVATVKEQFEQQS